MPSLFKKVIVSVLTFLTFFVSSTSFVLAQNEGRTTPIINSWYNQSFEQWYVKVYDDETSPPNEIFGERYTAAQVQWVVYSLAALPFVTGSEMSKQAVACALTKEIDECFEILSEFFEEVNQLSSGSNQNSNFLSTINLNSVSGIGYFRDVVSKFNPVSEVQAQGFGYATGGKFLQNLWGASRNIAYGLIVLAVIVSAFMIMFRVKISPQVVISIQSAIPKVIITLVLITFSYAIAGFMIDLMYVVLGLVATLITQSGLSSFKATEMFATFNSYNIFWLLMWYWGLFLIGGFAALIKGIGGANILGVVGFIFAIVAVVVLLWQSVKILFMLIKAFVQVMLSVAIGPLQILTGAFVPNAGFGPWIRGLASQLLIFPITAIMFFFAFYFLRIGFGESAVVGKIFPFGLDSQSSETAWSPPFLGNLSTGLGGYGQILVMAISYTIMVSISKVNEIIQGVISGRPFAFGTAIGESIGPAKGIAMYNARMMEQGRTPQWLANLWGKFSKTPPDLGKVQAFGRTLSNVLDQR